MDIRVGSTVRIVDFKPQYWLESERDDRRAEQSLMAGYLGKVGVVVHMDGWRIPVLVRFDDDARVPIREMRFHMEEVGEVG